MSLQRQIIIALPVYNEGAGAYNLIQRIDEVAAKLAPTSVSVLAVDDCSQDGGVTAAMLVKAQHDFPQLQVKIHSHEVNQGLGGALSTLLKAAMPKLNGWADVLVTMDGDDTHPAHLIPEMIAKIDQGADVVIGSRYCEASRIAGLSPFRIFLSLGARIVYTLRWRLPGVRDYTCLFRAYRAGVLQQVFAERPIELNEKGFTATTELLLRLAPFTRVFVEVPMILRYDQKMVTSSMKIIRTIQKTLRMTFLGHAE